MPARVALAAVAVLLVGCTGGDGADPTASPTATGPSEGSTTSGPTETTEPSGSPAPSSAPSAAPSTMPSSAPTPTPTPTPTSDPTSGADTSTQAFEPFTVPIGDQVEDTESGIQVELRQVEVRPDGLVVEVTSFNNTDRPAVLAARPDAVLVYDVDANRFYSFRAPEDNPKLRYAPGEELTANVAFPARFDRPPSQIEVAFNYGQQPFERLGEDAANAQVVQLHVGNIAIERP